MLSKWKIRCICVTISVLEVMDMVKAGGDGMESKAISWKAHEDSAALNRRGGLKY